MLHQKEQKPPSFLCVVMRVSAASVTCVVCALEMERQRVDGGWSGV